MMFVVCEVLAILFYRDTHASSVVSSLRYFPLACGVIILALGLAVRAPIIRSWIVRVALDHVPSRSISPLGIIRERKLDWRDFGWIAVAAVGAWLVEGYTFWLCLAAVGIKPPVILVFFGYSFVRLITLLPLSPGGIGELEGSAALFFAAYGYNVGPVVTAALIYRLVTYWPPLAIGAAAYLLAGRHGDTERMSLGLPRSSSDRNPSRS
jgi:uncharacterized membrane protein YbhN (UPF0104 family)